MLDLMMRRDGLPLRLWNPAAKPFYTRRFGGTWLLFAHRHVREVVTDPRGLFSQSFGDVNEPDPERWHPTFSAPWASDGATPGTRHHDLREAVGDPFGRRFLRELEPFVARRARELVDVIVKTGAGEVELMGEFAWPFSHGVICHIMGIAPERIPRFAEHLRIAVAAEHVATSPAQPELVRDLESLVAEYRERGRDGVLSHLLELQRGGHTIGGQPLSDRDLLGFLWSLLAAGTDTTAVSLVNALVLYERFGVLDQIRSIVDDDVALERATEEVLRYLPAFPAIRATATRDVWFGATVAPLSEVDSSERDGGVVVREGQFVTPFITSANRDPEAFSDPERFDIHRGAEVRRHLSFGWGTHYCLGAELARMELRVAQRELLTRLPGLRRKPWTRVKRKVGIVNRVREAKFVFGPRSRG